MSLHISSLLTFFNKKELNEFYLSISLNTFAESLISVFVPVYLYLLNYPIYLILFYYFLVSLYFVIFSYFGARVVSNIGVKRSMLLSTPFLIAYYLGLKTLASSHVLFFILPVLLSLRMILYNYGYHLNFIAHSEKKLRGRQLSLIGAFNVIATVAAPLISGLIIYYFNFSVIYIIGSILLIMSTIPLFFSKEKFEKIKFNQVRLFKDIFKKENKNLFFSFSGYAVESIIGRTIWPVFLIALLLNTKNMGIVITLSMSISIFVFYFAGQVTDKYNKIKLLKISAILYFFSWVGRIFANSSLKVLFIDSYKNVSEKILRIPWQAYSYDIAQQGDYFKFIVSREIIFNLSRAVLMPLLIIVFYFDFYPFVISFLTASIFSLFYIFITNSHKSI